MIKKVISFSNRSYIQLLEALKKLKERYKGYIVDMKKKQVGTLYVGSFSILYP